LDTTGFGLALLAMVLFGLYMVPRKLSGLRDFDFVLSMCVGAVLTTQLVQLAVHGTNLPPITYRGWWLSFSCGPLWALGMLFYTLSVSQMGLALSTPIKNTTAVLGTAFGLLVFAEWRQTSPVMALAGSVLVVACAVVLGRCGDREQESRSCVTPLGVVYALLAAVFFAAYTIPLKLAQADRVDTYELLALMGLGTLLGGVILFLVFSRNRRRWFTEPMPHHLWAALAGAIWASATLVMAHAIERVGLAVTWPVTNLNTIVTVAAGVVIFHEIDLRRRARDIALSMALAIAGTVLLGLSRR
jgi:glucose uptake protein